MFSLKRLNRFNATLGLMMLAFTTLMLAGSGGSKANELNVSDDSSFRRAMLQSSHVFAFGSTEAALEHWSNLWTVSSQLDERTRQARRGLLLTAVEPLLARANGPDSTASIQRVRNQLEEVLVNNSFHGRVPTEILCDWIVLNRILGDNDRTIEWIVQRCDAAPMSRLPKRVRELASIQLADDVNWDESCDCLVEKS